MDEPWDRTSVELVFGKATKVEVLAKGLGYIVPLSLKDVLKKDKDGEGRFWSWAVEIARDALGRGGFEE
jgi:hypothetical protein